MKIANRALRAEAALWDGETAGDWTPERVVIPRTWPDWLPAPRPLSVADLGNLGPGETGTLNRVLYIGAATRFVGVVNTLPCNPGDVLVYQRGAVIPMAAQTFADVYE